jgi:hypothetical protein
LSWIQNTAHNDAAEAHHGVMAATAIDYEFKRCYYEFALALEDD